MSSNEKEFNHKNLFQINHHKFLKAIFFTVCGPILEQMLNEYIKGFRHRIDIVSCVLLFIFVEAFVCYC